MIALVTGLVLSVVVLGPIAVTVYASLVEVGVDPRWGVISVLAGFFAGTLIAIELVSRVIAKGQRIFKKMTC